MITTFKDADGYEVPQTCLTCEHVYDDGDGPEYGGSWWKCRKKQHMKNLKGFPFNATLKCYEVAWYFTINWEEENRKQEAARAAFEGRE